jgi:hypothetical protein
MDTPPFPRSRLTHQPRVSSPTDKWLGRPVGPQPGKLLLAFARTVILVLFPAKPMPIFFSLTTDKAMPCWSRCPFRFWQRQVFIPHGAILALLFSSCSLLRSARFGQLPRKAPVLPDHFWCYSEPELCHIRLLRHNWFKWFAHTRKNYRRILPTIHLHLNFPLRYSNILCCDWKRCQVYRWICGPIRYVAFCYTS